MAENVVINGTTYPEVEAVALDNGNGEKAVFYPDAVRYTAQALTEAQKAQARENIGIPSEEAIIQQVIAALGTPVFGRVDENKHITLSGHLVDGTYTISFEDTDGFTSEVCTINKSSAPAYTNVLPLAINTDGTLYNGGQGWKTGFRLNSSGGEAAMDGMEVTGFIPVKHGDIVELKNVGWKKGASTTYAWCYDSSFNYIAYVNAPDVGNIASGYATFDSSDNLVRFVADHNFFQVAKGVAANEVNGKIAYFRLNCADISSDSIITVNQEIV